MSIQTELIENAQMARDTERRRIIGVILEQYGIYKLSGQDSIAKALDALALRIEHPDAE